MLGALANNIFAARRSTSADLGAPPGHGHRYGLRACGGVGATGSPRTTKSSRAVGSDVGWVSPSSKREGGIGRSVRYLPGEGVARFLGALGGSRLACPAGRDSNWTGQIGVRTCWFSDWPLVVARELPLWAVARALNVVGAARGFLSPLPGVGL